MSTLVSRFVRFRSQLATLWRAFLHPSTPLYLKAVMVGVVVYLVSPVDLLPDVFAVIGWIDDALLVALAINWIMARLPDDVFRSPTPTGRPSRGQQPQVRDTVQQTHARNEGKGPTIDGTSRRV